MERSLSSPGALIPPTGAVAVSRDDKPMPGPKTLNPDARETLEVVFTGDRAQDVSNVGLLLKTMQSYDSSRDLGEYLDRVVDMVVRLASAERGILLLKEGQDQAKVVAARNHERQTIVKLTQFSRTIARQVLDTGEPVCVVDTMDENISAMGQSVTELALKTLMCVPLDGRQGPIGVMYVDSRFKNREFTETDLQFFQAICHQAAQSIEHARLTQRLIEAEGFAALGSITQRLSTALTSPAKVIQGSAAMLRTFELEPDDVQRIGAEVSEFVDDILGLLHSIQEYAFVAAPDELSQVDAEEHVRAVLARFAPEFQGQSVEVFVGSQGNATIEVDLEKMELALHAVALNAMEAMLEGGKLVARVKALEGGTVAIQLSDTGCGMPKEFLEKACEPFATLGKRNRVGLGLATAVRIVELHGGSIELESVEGEGTQVTIVLPSLDVSN
jgi:signal transduction histidine kinase